MAHQSGRPPGGRPSWRARVDLMVSATSRARVGGNLTSPQALLEQLGCSGRPQETAGGSSRSFRAMFCATAVNPPRYEFPRAGPSLQAGLAAYDRSSFLDNHHSSAALSWCSSQLAVHGRVAEIRTGHRPASSPPPSVYQPWRCMAPCAHWTWGTAPSNLSIVAGELRFTEVTG